jgi:hypothetical protein
MKFTPTQWRVIVAAYITGSAGEADIDSGRVKTRTISALQDEGLLMAKHIDGSIPLSEAGETAFWQQRRASA